MKRVLMMCFMLIIVFTMIGCNSSHNNKESVQWCDYLNREVNYYGLNELVDIERITTSEFVKKFESVKWTIYKEEDVNKIIDIINVPYIDYSEVNESTDSVYDLLFKGSDDFYFIEFDINEDKGFMIYICSKGYVSLSTAEKNYISLAKVDFKSISSICESIRTGK